MPSRTLTPDLLPSPEPLPSAELPGLRLVKVPDAAPPYDCEIHGAACPATQDAAGAGPHGAAPSPGSAWPRHAVTPDREAAGVRRTSTGAAREASTGRAREASTGRAREAQPGRAREAPPGRAREAPPGRAREAPPGRAGGTDVWPRQLAQVIVEILAGLRSPRQLVPLTTDRVRAQIGLLARSLGGDQRPRIKRVMTFRPAADVLEMTVVVSFGPRSRALAMRFERRPARPATPGLPARPARWLCTDLEAG